MNEINFMRKLLLLAPALISFCLTCFSQETTEAGSVGTGTSFFAEIGGPGILFSANFDKRFKQTHLGWGGRIGVGFVTSYEENFDPSTRSFTGATQRSVLSIPIQINHIFGKVNSPHTFEAGAGFTLLSRKMDVFSFYNDDQSLIFGTFSFMYRRQPPNGGFSWRIGFTPIVTSGYIQPSAGASVGYNF